MLHYRYTTNKEDKSIPQLPPPPWYARSSCSAPTTPTTPSVCPLHPGIQSQSWPSLLSRILPSSAPAPTAQVVLLLLLPSSAASPTP